MIIVTAHAAERYRERWCANGVSTELAHHGLECLAQHATPSPHTTMGGAPVWFCGDVPVVLHTEADLTYVVTVLPRGSYAPPPMTAEELAARDRGIAERAAKQVAETCASEVVATVAPEPADPLPESTEPTHMTTPVDVAKAHHEDSVQLALMLQDELAAARLRRAKPAVLLDLRTRLTAALGEVRAAKQQLRVLSGTDGSDPKWKLLARAWSVLARLDANGVEIGTKARALCAEIRQHVPPIKLEAADKEMGE